MRNKGERQSKDISLAECTEVEGRLLYRGSIYVPDYDPLKLRILKLYHDAVSAGHPGREKHLNSSFETTTGPLCGIILPAMFGTATSVNEVNPTPMENSAYFDLYRFLNNHGKRYQWTSLLAYRRPKGTMQLW
jgi:hypothetical protein